MMLADSDGGAGIVWLIIIGIIVFANLVNRSAKSDRATPYVRPQSDDGKRAVWQLLAKRIGGRLIPREKYRLIFKWQGYEAEFAETDTGHALWIPCEGFYPRRILLWHKKLERRGRQLIPTNLDELAKVESKSISKRFRVYAKRKDDAIQFLKSKVVGKLIISTGVDMIEITKKNFVMTWAWKGRVPRRDMVIGSLKLALHARQSYIRDTGVRVLKVEKSKEGECQVCGSDLGGQLVRCGLCRTPHHEDCWEYTGVCSTFGCGGKDIMKS